MAMEGAVDAWAGVDSLEEALTRAPAVPPPAEITEQSESAVTSDEPDATAPSPPVPAGVGAFASPDEAPDDDGQEPSAEVAPIRANPDARSAPTTATMRRSPATGTATTTQEGK
jgi:hypothetical protein